MYPTIHNFDTNPLHAYPSLAGSGSSGSGSGSGGSGSTTAPASRPLPPPRANGPPPPPTLAFPTLQVTIDPRFQVAPPVRAPPQPPGEGFPLQHAHGPAAPPPPPGHPAPGGTGQPLDLDLERKLVQEAAEAASSTDKGSGLSSSAAAAAAAAAQRRDDPYDVLLGRYTEMGYSREEVAMALAVVGPEHSDNADLIVDTCRKYKRLCSMGFRSDLVAGALIVHDGDVEAAATTCLDAAN